ncbi:hypothetical protein ACQ4PT_024396 [Festuca glaucescens]
MAAPNPGGGDRAGLSFAGDPAGLSFPDDGDPAALSFPGDGDSAALSFHGGGEVDSSSGGTDFTNGTSGCSSYSKTPVSSARLSLEHRAAAALAKTVIASPTKSSHRWASSLGSVDLDDDIWEIRFHFHGEDNLERTLGRSDITVLNLLALVEGHGYGIRDLMYYHKAEWPVGLNRDEMDGPVELEEPVVLSVDNAGVSFYSQKGDNTDDLVQVAKLTILSEDEEFYYDIGQYRPEERAAEREKAISAKLELMHQLRKQKKQKAESPENVAILEKLRHQNQQ